MKAVLVTRPSPDGERTCAALAAKGIRSIHAPLMTIEIGSFSAPTVPFEALAFTSANGVRAYASQDWARPLPAYTVGPASAQAAKAAGLSVAAIGGGDSESLAALIAERPPTGPILHVRGAHAAGDLCYALARYDIEAHATELYRATAVSAFDKNAVDAITTSDIDIALFSARTARLFAILVETHGLREKLAHSMAFCLSAAVADEIRTLPFRHIHAAMHPQEGCFVDMVLSVRK